MDRDFQCFMNASKISCAKVLTRLLLLILLSLQISCSLWPFEESEEKPIDYLAYPKELKDVPYLISKGKNKDAMGMVENYLTNSDRIHWFGHAYFLKAFIFEETDRLAQAEDWYRRAIQHGSQYNSKLEAKALYNLSFTYEKQNDLPKLLTSLIDLMKRRSFFGALTGQVEIPARLAAAYASQGRFREAKAFHGEASGNYKLMVRDQRFQAKREELSKSLFYLGLVTFDQNNESYDSLIAKLQLGQKYFLASSEADKGLWANRSSQRLADLYNRAWGMVLQYMPEGLSSDPVAQKKQKQERQLTMASDLYDLMFTLRAEEFPLGGVNNQSRSVLAMSEQWTDKIEDFVLKLDLGPQLIRSQKIANRRLPRAVRVDKELTRINKENLSEPEPLSLKKPPKTPAKVDKKADIGKDPNL